jgi:demethylmenaquinone methyltransferase/2-methoxy-6-polyprenyl-1,4-benzoquinol methylase
VQAERLKSVKRPETRERIQEMFSSIAARYDIANTLVSFGRHYYWKRLTVTKADVKTGDKVLDLCAGTCDLAIMEAKIVGNSGRVTAVDFTLEMLDVGKHKAEKAGLADKIEFMIGDAHKLPFSDNVFDGLTIATATRHLDLDIAFREMYRVLKPGGKISCLDFFIPPNKLFKSLYDFYSYSIMRRAGIFITKDKTGIYDYFPDTIRVFLTPDEFKEKMEKAGFKNVKYQRLTGGIVCIHTGDKEA